MFLYLNIRLASSRQPIASCFKLVVPTYEDSSLVATVFFFFLRGVHEVHICTKYSHSHFHFLSCKLPAISSTYLWLSQLPQDTKHTGVAWRVGWFGVHELKPHLEGVLALITTNLQPDLIRSNTTSMPVKTVITVTVRWMWNVIVISDNPVTSHSGSTLTESSPTDYLRIHIRSWTDLFTTPFFPVKRKRHSFSYQIITNRAPWLVYVSWSHWLWTHHMPLTVCMLQHKWCVFPANGWNVLPPN